MDIRLQIQEIERQVLSPYATLSENTKGRKKPEDPCPLRTDFQRDRDRIIHSKAFRRLKQKTQVFLSPEGDHYRTRLTHTLEVTQIARTIARALHVNEDLTEAIALGHDLGHTPFGHAGERALNKLNPDGFKHYEQSVRVVNCLECQQQGLNLTQEVLDGMERHTGGEWAKTPEGCIVRYADRIAYVNHDIEDAITAKVLCSQDLPKKPVEILGNTKSKRITSLIVSLVENSHDGKINYSPECHDAFIELHSFMYSTVYVDPIAKAEENKVDHVMESLFIHYKKTPEDMPDFYCTIAKQESVNRAVTDYIAGMSDDYAVSRYSRLFVPRKWEY